MNLTAASTTDTVKSILDELRSRHSLDGGTPLSLNALANMTGVDRAYLWRIYNGHRRMSASQAGLIAHALCSSKSEYEALCARFLAARDASIIPPYQG